MAITKEIEVELKLHQAQEDFCTSRALYRGFVGGRGAGKTVAGTLDMLLRCQADRTYLIASPTFQMLQDTTFPTFRDKAKELHLWNPATVRLTPAPSVVLANGASIRFRSAEDPERMRGPNLSGIWLDEASQMEEAAYNVSIACLREQGQQGWLSATFTPRGRAHWTFRVFGEGGPDSEMFHARTRDNPFNPPEFHDTLAKQYTTVFGMQELEGEFLGVLGAMFRREWFKIVDVAPAQLRLVRAWDLAATTPRDANDPDYTAGVWMGRSADGLYCIQDVRHIRYTAKDVERMISITADLDGKTTQIWMEEEPGSAGKALADHYCRTVLPGYSFYSERPTGDKATRASPFAAMSEAGNVHLVRGAWNKEFLDEVESFPMGPHDDMVDAASLAFSKVSVTRTFAIGV